MRGLTGRAVGALLVLFTLFLGASVAVSQRMGTNFSAQVDADPTVQDYWSNALGHAHNLDAWREQGIRTHSYHCNNHPGLPVQLFSSLVYGLTNEAGPPTLGLEAVCRQPDRFVKASRAGMALLGFLSVVMVFWATRQHGLGYATAASLAAYTTPWGFHWTFQTLGEDIFTMVLCPIVFGFAALTLAKPHPWRWLALGVLAGLAYLNKLPYLTWFAGLLVGWVCWAKYARGSRSSKGLALLSLCAGFLLSLAAYTLLYAGTEGMATTLEFHANIATHQARYGYGPSGVFPEGSVLWVNLRHLGTQETGVCLCVLLMSVLGVQVFRQRRHEPSWAGSRGPLLVALSVAAGLSVVSLLKHYQWYYISLLGTLLPISYWALAGELSPRTRKVVALLTLGGVALSWSTFYGRCRAGLHEVESVQSGLRAWEQSGARILWGYRSPGPVALLGRVSLFAGQPLPLSSVFAEGQYFEVKHSKYVWGTHGAMTPLEAAWTHALDWGMRRYPGARYPWETWRRVCSRHSFGGRYVLLVRTGWRPLADPQEWRFTEQAPPADWASVNHDDSAWSSGRPGFGDPWVRDEKAPFPEMLTHLHYSLKAKRRDFAYPFTRLVRTLRTEEELWFRRTIELSEDQVKVFCLALNHDAEVRVMLNGFPVHSATVPADDGFELYIPDERARARLSPGKNVVAIHCPNRGYVQVIPALKLEEKWAPSSIER